MASQSNPPVIHLSEEEDLGHSHFVRFDDEYTHPDRLGKGKDRETHSPVSEDDTSYPPVNEDAEETRRIEEVYSFSTCPAHAVTLCLEPKEMGNC